MDSILLDTHALIWFWEDSPKLKSKIKVLIRKAKLILVPTIVLVEVFAVIDKNQSKLKIEEIWQVLHRDSRIKIIPFDELILNEYLRIDKLLEIHDRIIVASAKFYDSTIITRDPEIKEVYKITTW